VHTVELFPMDLRDLQSQEEFADVVELQRRVWGSSYEDVVPRSIFSVVVKRGGILVGAFDQTRMVAFVFSWPGLKAGRTMQWSHMLAVDEAYRRSGVGYRLKLAQRDRTLAQGLDLIEWTYDPLQAANAHLNFARLGVVVEDYLENVYGTSGSVLHQGAPTDRFVAAWHLASPHVERRLAREASLLVRDASLGDVCVVNRTRMDGAWLMPSGEPELGRDEARLFVEIPTRFGEMLLEAPERALEWRMTSRRIFTTYFARGYRCVDFLLDRERERGRYLLQRIRGAED
jgi:predicted GNAT superfamily acetyltransferase